MVPQVYNNALWHRVQHSRKIRPRSSWRITHKRRYRFKADLHGTSWYHSHYSAQYVGGLLGPMIIHGPDHVSYDLDLGPVMVSDCNIGISFVGLG